MPTKSTHGGARAGAGRNAKEGPPKKTLSVAVDQVCIERLKDLAKKTGISQAKITQFAILEMSEEKIKEKFKKKT